MNKFTSWKEYLNDRGNLVEKPDIDKVPDYDGPDSKSPQAGEGQKVKGDKKLDPIPNAAKSSGKPAPYKSATSNEAPKKAEEKGLSSNGDQKLVYEPNTDIKGGENMPGGKVVSGAWPKTKTESFLEKTGRMGMYDFAKYMLEDYNVSDEDSDDLPTVTAYATGKIHPHPPEAIRYIVSLAKKNKKILEALIHEMKNAGLMKGMLETTMDHPEAHEEMADILGDDENGPKHAGALARAMDGKVNKFKQEQDDMWESVAPPFGSAAGDPFGNKDEDEPKNDEDDSDEDQGEGEEDGEDQSPEDDSSEEPKDSEKEMDSEEQEKEEKPEKKLKKKFGCHHLIDQMKKFDHLKEYMKQ